jgi:HK97 family phage prohead protease
MALEYVGTFILTDESLDRHSERVIVKGIDLAPFKKNPVMFYNHIRTMASWWGGDAVSEDSVLPIGRWENVKKVGNTQIEADAYIDMDDEFAAKIGGKVKNGIINAVSIGFKGMAYSDAEEDKVLGQKGVTITKSELMEASLVDIPANPNATILSKTVHEKSATAQNGEAGEIYFVKTFHKKEQSMDTNSMFDAVRNFIKKSFGKDVTTEAEALSALQEGAENPNLSLDAVKAAMKADFDSAIKSATDAIRTEMKADVLALTKTVGEMAAAMESLTARPDEVEDTTEQIDELKAAMDDISAKMAAMTAKKSGIAPKADATPPVKGENETQEKFEQRQTQSIRGLVKARTNHALKN